MVYSPKDHTFAICAYGENKYLEGCIRSVLDQELKTNVIMCTSTPLKSIKDIACKYNIPLFINKDNVGGIAGDWNFSLKCAGTKLVTLAHQDDIYKSDYAKKVLDNLNKAKHPLIAFTNYSELRNGHEVKDIKNLKIKRIMLLPLRIRSLWRSVFIRRRILSFGSAICCPSVTYVVDNLPEEKFDGNYSVALDWHAWERFSRLRGDFVFVNDILMAHRIHEGSETTKNINNSNRTKEDFDMFCKFWPRSIASLIEHYYKKSEEQNSL